MGRKLSQMTTEQLRQEMSMFGNPDKFIEMKDRILGIMAEVNSTDSAELINLELLMEVLLSESRTWMKIYESRTKQKIYVSKNKYR